MENGGGGEHRPWMFDEETTDIYRDFVNLHEALIPYIYSSAAYSYELGLPTMRPQDGDYIYMLGDNLLVAPFFEAGDTREVVFPEGEWIYLFDESEVHVKGTETLTFGLDEFPVYIRKGAVIPMETADETAFGSALSGNYTTVLVYPQNGTEKFGLYEEDKTGAMLSYTKDDTSLTLKSTATDRALLFRVFGQSTPASMTDGGGNTLFKASSLLGAIFTGGYYTDDSGVTWIAVNSAQSGAEFTVNY